MGTSGDSNLETSKITDYVGNKVYENEGLKRILIDGGYIENNVYHYYLKDHLGNNRVVINQYNEQIQNSQYYPFGMAMAESTSQSTQPYKYNGKELDKTHGLNLYDYSARYYDGGALGRFTTVDPLAEKYYSWSPYVYCANNPMRYIDPLGMDTININAEGKITQHIKSKDRTVFNITDKDGNIKSSDFEYTPIVSSVETIKNEDGTTTEYTYLTMLGGRKWK